MNKRLRRQVLFCLGLLVFCSGVIFPLSFLNYYSPEPPNSLLLFRQRTVSSSSLVSSNVYSNPNNPDALDSTSAALANLAAMNAASSLLNSTTKFFSGLFLDHHRSLEDIILVKLRAPLKPENLNADGWHQQLTLYAPHADKLSSYIQEKRKRLVLDEQTKSSDEELLETQLRQLVNLHHHKEISANSNLLSETANILERVTRSEEGRGEDEPLTMTDMSNSSVSLTEPWKPGMLFEADSSQMELLDIRVDFMDGKDCPQSLDTQSTYCPHFLACPGNFSNLAFCRNPQWEQEGIDKIVHQSVIYRLPQPVIAFSAHVAAAQKVYISSTGHVFDRNYRYVHGGCSEFERGFQMKTVGNYSVYRFDEVIDMLNIYSSNFFHQLVELGPSFLQILPLLQVNPEIPILVNKEFNSPDLLRFMGIDERKLNFHFVMRDSNQVFYYGERVYFPLMAPCHYMPKTLWQTIRYNYYKWTGQEILGFPLPEPEKLKPDNSNLRVIFLKRVNPPGAKKPVERFLENFDEILHLLQTEISPGYLTVYTETPVKTSIELFSQTHILLGVHGAGLSNMAFMSKKRTAVVEILPNEYENHCFYNLARTLGLYHMKVEGYGKKNTGTKVEPEKVLKAMKAAIEYLRKKQG